MRTATLTMLLVLASAAHAQIVHQTLYSGLTGPDLVQALRTQEAVPTTIGYGPARDSIYTWEQRTYGRLRCVYTGYQVVIPIGGLYDASTEAYARGINAEHTWPQSMGAGGEPEASDLHNLYPTRVDVNAARGNMPFGESPDAQTNRWYRLGSNQAGAPTTAIDEWSEVRTNTLFEPREDHKGNAARSMLYFFSRWSGANTTYLPGQVEALVAWSEADPVDQAEWNRMMYVQGLQHNRNPFIVDPSLARRAFLPGTIDPNPATYTVSSPAAGTVLRAGTKTVVRWSGPGVPFRTIFVDIFLVKGTGTPVPVGSGKNIGRLKVTLPGDLVTGSDYSFRIVRQDDQSVYGTSTSFIVTSPSGQYTVADPDEDETWARTRTHIVQWAAPPTAPAGGTVRLELRRDNDTLVATYPGQSDDGTFDLATSSSLAAGTFFLTVTNDTDAAFQGQSPRFGIGRIEVDAPAEGATWTAGSARTVTWVTGDANAAGAVKLTLMQIGGPYSKTLAASVPFVPGVASVTVPADVPAGAYVVRLVYTYTPPGGVEMRDVVRSNTFSVTGAAASLPVAARHFASPPPVPGLPETLLAVRGLSEGDEVGVFVSVGGDEALLASGVVEDGEALVAVPSEVALEGEVWYLGETAALALRVFEGTTEAAVTVRSVRLGSDGSVLAGARLAAGDVVTVDAAKSGLSDAAPAVFAVQGVSPNPASTLATVRFTSPSSAPATVVVYDLLGRVVATPFVGEAVIGSNEVSLSTASVPAGVYVVRVTVGAETATARVTVAR